MKEFYTQYILHNLPFHILTGIAIALIIISFILPPTGEIDPSVLQGVGEIFGFLSLYTVLRVIEKGTGASFKKGDIELEIQEDHEHKEEAEE